jgi:asparagine synthase (glutamine-hydrolysing)
MCGIAGFIKASFSNDEIVKNLHNMNETIISRGPDDSGVWVDESTGLGLTHRRLAVVDLSSAGHQPMMSTSGRFVISFNGEIYNHIDIRDKINKSFDVIGWNGDSDTETLLAAIDVWGVEKALKECVGMIALALWDRQEKALYLARDRVGEKPLYYGWQSGAFIFGSELKALKVHPDFEGKINRNAIVLQLRHNCIPAPHTIYQGINKLPPGTFIKLDFSDGVSSVCENVVPTVYWSLTEVIERGLKNPFIGNDLAAVELLHDQLLNSVGQQMVSDVPLGAFLSGGVDSSTIVSLMQSQSSVPVKTFSIGFNENDYNEAVYAKTVADHLGTEHTELYVTADQAMDVIPKLPSIFDEPFSDSSQIPTYLVSEMTRQHVTVALSGDAGDELFGGYNRYFKTHQWWNKIEYVPNWIRGSISIGILSVSPNSWDRVGAALGRLPGNSASCKNMGRTLSKLAGVLAINDGAQLYRYFISHWDDPESIVIGGYEENNSLHLLSNQEISMVEQMMKMDTMTYLPDDILTKVDRAAMAVSLEVRVPFLDHNVIEFAWRLPLSMKIRDGQGKWILRQILYKYVPKEMIERPKVGFGVPIGAWLRGPLRDWAESLLDESRLRREGFFNPEPIRQKWNEHISGRHDWQYHLWDILMFQAWLEAQE